MSERDQIELVVLNYSKRLSIWSIAVIDVHNNWFSPIFYFIFKQTQFDWLRIFWYKYILHSMYKIHINKLNAINR